MALNFSDHSSTECEHNFLNCCPVLYLACIYKGALRFIFFAIVLFPVCSCLILLLISQMYTAKASAALTSSANADANRLFLEALKVGVLHQ